MNIVIGILVVVLGVAFSIGLHEIGHMVPAKQFGVRVSQYMIGFGPTIWSKTVGETEYGLKAIPLGGYVRLVGMMPPLDVAHPERVPEYPNAKVSRGFFKELIADARDASTDEILPGEESRAFYNLSAPKKITVMLGGPVMNLVLAVAFMAIFMSIGMSEWAPTNSVGSVAPCVALSPDQPCDPATDQSPAAAAGLQPGDKITRINAAPIATWDDLTAAIAAADQPFNTVTFERGGVEHTADLTPINVQREVALDDGTTELVTVPVIGIGSAWEPTGARTTIPLSELPGQVGEMFTGTAGAVVRLPVAVYDAVAQTVTGQERAQDGVMSVVGIGQVAAEGANRFEGLDLMAFLISLLASLNMALFVFNLIPLLPLDGGHVANALFEGGRRTIARLRGQSPLPGPADVAKMMPVAYIMFAVLGVSAVLLILADFINPIQIFG